jgi:hypothetical protein
MPSDAVRQFAGSRKVEIEELVRARVGVLGALDVDAADPVSFVDEIIHKVVSDETSCTRNEYSRLRSHDHPCRLRVTAVSNPCE